MFMSNKTMSKTAFQILDEYISVNPAKSASEYKESLEVSVRDMEYGKKLYGEIVKQNSAVAQVFGSNCMGMHAYGMYKPANSQKVYVYDAWIQDLQSYCEIENDSWFD